MGNMGRIIKSQHETEGHFNRGLAVTNKWLLKRNKASPKIIPCYDLQFSSKQRLSVKAIVEKGYDNYVPWPLPVNAMT